MGYTEEMTDRVPKKRRKSTKTKKNEQLKKRKEA
jgi:hypothetical protein